MKLRRYADDMFHARASSGQTSREDSMSHISIFASVEHLHVELLPERTVLSMFGTQGTGSSSGGSIADPVLMMLGISQGGHGTPGADGQAGQGDS